eukprot:3739696-Rhodomonas_salina.1
MGLTPRCSNACHVQRADLAPTSGVLVAPFANPARTSPMKTALLVLSARWEPTIRGRDRQTCRIAFIVPPAQTRMVLGTSRFQIANVKIVCIAARIHLGKPRVSRVL